ncbi:hypothetical protein BD779DRAFT_802697 [Infundibulicybe gibba]|nr:hypothetical protein BD779DRAFT_802697 [Infundibulicybe gibba]
MVAACTSGIARACVLLGTEALQMVGFSLACLSGLWQGHTFPLVRTSLQYPTHHGARPSLDHMASPPHRTILRAPAHLHPPSFATRPRPPPSYSLVPTYVTSRTLASSFTPASAYFTRHPASPLVLSQASCTPPALYSLDVVSYASIGINILCNTVTVPKEGGLPCSVTALTMITEVRRVRCDDRE